MKLKDTRGEVRQGIRFRDAEGLTAEYIAKAMRQLCEEKNIPATISVSDISTGGLFGNSYPCVLIKHPNPPQSYFDQIVVINENTLSFYFYGYSKANTQINKQEMRKGSSNLLDNVVGGLMRDSRMELNVEQSWHADICDVYDEIFA